ncbi:hypothetical protein GQ457_04G026280 [Hibiscus cannabinus]
MALWEIFSYTSGCCYGAFNVIPIAFAIVEGETGAAWNFFLTNLREHVVLEDGETESMAPKIKRPRSGASTSSGTNPQPNFNSLFAECFNEPNNNDSQFHNFQFFKNFPIRKGRVVDYDFLTSPEFNFRYMQQLIDWKFTTFLQIKPRVFHTLVRIFYSNARKVVRDGSVIAIKSYLMGKTFSIDAKTIADHLGLENIGLDDETAILPNLIPPGTSVFTLDAHDRFLHLMITWFFRPSGGKFSTIRGVDAFWLQCFQNNARIDLAQIIFVELVYILNNRMTSHVKSFTYATVLSHIFIKECIDCSLDLECPLTHTINAKSLRKSKFQFINGEWVRDLNAQEGDDDDDVHAPPVAAQQVSVELIQGLFQDLNANINSRFNSMEARMSAFESRFKLHEDQLNRVEMNLDAFHLEWRTQNFPPSDSTGDDVDVDGP